MWLCFFEVILLISWIQILWFPCLSYTFHSFWADILYLTFEMWRSNDCSFLLFMIMSPHIREIGFGLYGHLWTSSGLHLTRVELLQIKWIDREGFLHNLLKLLFGLILCSLVLCNSRLYSILLICNSYIHCWYVDYDTCTKYLILQVTAGVQSCIQNTCIEGQFPERV